MKTKIQNLKLLLLIILLFLATFSVSGEKVASFSTLNRPNFLGVDKNALYITDGAAVSIISLKDYSLIKQFGESGEGPGQFKVNPYRKTLALSILPDSLFISSISRISYFDKKGNFLKEINTLASSGVRLKPIGEKFVGKNWFDDPSTSTSFIVNYLFDSKFKIVKELFRSKQFMQPAGTINPFDILGRKMVVYKNRSFVHDPVDFKIFIFDINGEKINTVTNKYTNIKMTEKYKSGVKNWFKTNLAYKTFYENWKNRIEFPKYIPAIREIKVADDKIYVLTHKKKGKKSEFYIFDLKGHLLKTTFTSFGEKNDWIYSPYTIRDGKLYQIIENIDEEEWELHVTNIL